MYDKIINALKQSLLTTYPDAVLTADAEVCVLPDESVQVEFQLDGDDSEYTLTFTPNADGKYETDGKIQKEDAQVAQEEESDGEMDAKKAPVATETKSDEEQAKQLKMDQAKADDYSEMKAICTQIKADMENMSKELTELKSCMVKAPEAKAETEEPEKEAEAKAKQLSNVAFWKRQANFE